MLSYDYVSQNIVEYHSILEPLYFFFFSFYLFFWFDFSFSVSFISWTMKRHMTMVTWYDIISLEHSKRNWNNSVKGIVVVYSSYNNSMMDSWMTYVLWQPLDQCPIAALTSKSQRQISSGKHELYNSQENSIKNYNHILPTIYMKSS